MESAGTPKWMYWLGWIVTLLPVAGLLLSAGMKFAQPAEMPEQFSKLGWPMSLAITLGVIELVCTILYLVPYTSVLGAILLTGYLGGAIATHVRIGDDFLPPIIIGVLMWLGLFLRDARIRDLIPYRKT